MANATFMVEAFFVASKIGKTGLTDVVFNVYEHDIATQTDSLFLTNSSGTAVGGGLYRLYFTGDEDRLYTGIGRTADSSVDAQHLPALGSLLVRMGNVDVSISDIKSKTDNLPADPASNTQVNTRLAFASYTTPPTAVAISDQVWDEAIAGHLTAGSTGEKLNAAGSSADPLASAVPGAYANGTAGYVLGSLRGKTVKTVSVIADSGDIEIDRGYDYYIADGRALEWVDTDLTWPDLTGATATFIIGGIMSKAGTITTPAGPATIQFELTKVETAAIPYGDYDFVVNATLANNHVILTIRGKINVNREVTV